MKIKKNDKVKMISGKDKGKEGKVLQVFPKEGKIAAEGLNIRIKHMRPRRQGEKGQKIEFPSPFFAARSMLVCPRCNRPTRVGYKLVVNEGKKAKLRICKKCKESIE
jgi:large subunit ribosomal protein L24